MSKSSDSSKATDGLPYGLVPVEEENSYMFYWRNGPPEIRFKAVTRSEDNVAWSHARFSADDRVSSDVSRRHSSNTIRLDRGSKDASEKRNQMSNRVSIHQRSQTDHSVEHQRPKGQQAAAVKARRCIRGPHGTGEESSQYHGCSLDRSRSSYNQEYDLRYVGFSFDAQRKMDHAEKVAYDSNIELEIE